MSTRQGSVRRPYRVGHDCLCICRFFLLVSACFALACAVVRSRPRTPPSSVLFYKNVAMLSKDGMRRIVPPMMLSSLFPCCVRGHARIHVYAYTYTYMHIYKVFCHVCITFFFVFAPSYCVQTILDVSLWSLPHLCNTKCIFCMLCCGMPVPLSLPLPLLHSKSSHTCRHSPSTHNGR